MIRHRFGHLGRLVLLAALGCLAFPTLAPGQSLWQRGKPDAEEAEARGHGSIYLRAEKKRPSIQKNDIVLIDVSEVSRASSDARLQAEREMQLELALDQWVHFNGGSLRPDTAPQPEIDIESSRELDGRGRTDRNESIRLRIAARVVDVLPNGNVVLEARKQRRINDEVTILTLSGEVSSADIAPDYAISSDRIADMKFSMSGEGPVSANTRWTWLARIVDFIWPF